MSNEVASLESDLKEYRLQACAFHLAVRGLQGLTSASTVVRDRSVRPTSRPGQRRATESQGRA